MAVAQLEAQPGGSATNIAMRSPRNDRSTRVARPRRVLFMDHTAELGGGEIALLNLARTLDRTRYVPIVVLFSDGPLLQLLKDSGVETHLVPLDLSVVDTRKDTIGTRSLFQYGKIKSAVRFIGRLRQCIRELAPDLIHTNSLKSDLLGGVAARLTGVPLVWHLRDRIADDYLPRNVVRAFRFLSTKVPDFVIAVSKGSLRTLVREGSVGMPKHSRVVYDGTPDLEELPASHDVLPPSDHAPLIAIVGRISRWKGQHIFICAAARVLRRFPNARFQIVGAAMFEQEAYEQEIRELVQELNIVDKIEFTGFRKDVKKAIQEVDLLVHASITGEPFGMVVMEGMAQGKPIVCTNGGGMPEVIEHGVTGLLVPMGDEVAMADAIETFIADPAIARRFGRKGWERVRDRFTIERVSNDVQEIYDTLVPCRT